MNDNKQTDDQLLQQFFADAHFDVPDDGFSDRVMRRLPLRMRRLNQIWTTVCFATGMLLFLLFDGITALRLQVYSFTGDLMGYVASAHINFSTIASMLMAVVVLGMVALYNFLSTQR